MHALRWFWPSQERLLLGAARLARGVKLSSYPINRIKIIFLGSITLSNFAIAIVCAVMVFSGLAYADSFVGPSGQRFQQAKCSRSPTACYETARAECRGPYQIIDSESHAGGLLADVLPGPFTWYSFSYICGRSDGRLAAFPFRGTPAQMPQVQAPTFAAPPARSMTNCSSSRVGNSVHTTCF